MAYSFNAELWAEFAIGMIVLAVRFYTRWTTIGIRNFAWDDFFAGLAAVFWTLEATFLYTCALYGNNIGLNAETAEQVPESMVPRLRFGSKLAYAAWVFYILLVWALKGVLIFLYSRITTGLWQHRVVKLVGVFCVLTFAASILVHFCSCLPISRSWQIKPFPGVKCTTRPLNYIVIEILNILCDASIIAVPLPVVFAAQIPMYRKIILGVLFSSGVFVIICAILRSYYSVKNIEHLDVALGWATREIFVSAIAVSAPGIKPLFNKSRWFGSSKKTSAKKYGSTGTSTFPWSNNPKSAADGNFTSVGVDDDDRQFELSSGVWPKHAKAKRLSSGESEEHIIGAEQNHQDQNQNFQIQVTTEYTVQQEEGSRAKLVNT